MPTRKAGEIVLQAVDRVVESRWEHATFVATSTNGSVEERVAQLRRTYVREMTTLGAASGAAAAVPGTGALALVGTTALEMGWFTTRTSSMILAVAAVHGHTTASVEERRAWVLSVLAFGDAAAKGFARVAGEGGKGLGTRATAGIPTELLRAVNRKLGRTIITKYGTKRGAVALGRALPFGIGAAIGGGANYALADTIARQADQFFRQLPPRLEAVVALPPDAGSDEPSRRT